MSAWWRHRRPRPPLDHRRIRDRALILPIVGLLLLMPPIAGAFQIDLRLAGVPFTAVYLFVVWAALIAGAAVLTPSLSALAEEPWRVDAPRAGEGSDAEV
ncbi:MAG: hypothetical protein H6983_00570 [Ectothiorhodospiraceae bacterium]|nr:hypothetical protein [Ectothiorhodospiraceae bacterium]